MPARLFCKTGEFAGASFEVGRETTIGRGPDGGAGVSSDVISGRHARIYFDDAEGGYFLEDLGSRNGTRLDGTEVRGPVRLGPLHVVTLADRIDFIYHETYQPAGAPAHAVVAPAAAPEHAPEELEEEAGKTHFVAVPAVALPPETGEQENLTMPEEPVTLPPLPHTGRLEAATMLEHPRFALEISQPGREPRRVLLVEGENTVGRALGCAVTLETASVSRQHAVMRVRAGRVTVRDLGSRNKTFLRGEPVAGEAEVAPDAVLRFGLEIEAALRRV